MGIRPSSGTSIATWFLAIPADTAFAAAVAVWVVSVLAARAMDARGRRGPAEWLLRRLTYGR